jgi:hypothetical protein
MPTTRKVLLVGAFSTALAAGGLGLLTGNEREKNEVALYIFLVLLVIPLSFIGLRLAEITPSTGKLFLMSRPVRIVFASCAASLSALMLIAVATMPWIGPDALMDYGSWLFLAGAVLAYPLMLKYLK